MLAKGATGTENSAYDEAKSENYSFKFKYIVGSRNNEVMRLTSVY